MVRISTFNPNRFRLEQLSLQLQNCINNKVDVQCYNEINQDVFKPAYRENAIKLLKDLIAK